VTDHSIYDPAKADFLEQVNTKFQVILQGRPLLELELKHVEIGHSTTTQEQFSLIFYGPKDVPLAQGTFELEHEKMGRFAIFLVPMNPDQRGPRYQAVFNRLVGNSP
jgi:hypothetical protein